MRNARESDLVSSKPCLFQRVGLALKPSPGVYCVCWVQAPENKLITLILIVPSGHLSWLGGEEGTSGKGQMAVKHVDQSSFISNQRLGIKLPRVWE